MRNITEITRRDIFDLFQKGYDDYTWPAEKQHITYHYHGRLSEIDFLKKLYSLDKMPSHDERYENAEGDIQQHTINDNDWESDWIFTDDRFELLNGEDGVLLNFLCAVFHPENRCEAGHWEACLKEINAALHADGYEMYESDKISQRSVYSYRKISEEELASRRFIPFSVRNKKAIDAGNINLQVVSKKISSEIIQLFNRFDKVLDETTETGFNYIINAKDLAFKKIKQHYAHCAFDNSDKYADTDNLDDFIMKNDLCYVFDAIELFPRQSNDSFADEINLLLKNEGITYKLAGGKMEPTEMTFKSREVIPEPKLKEMIEHATTLYNSKSISDKQHAVEKIWDALERLKTYYHPNLDKKNSLEKIVDDMSKQNDNYKDLFNDEFRKLTNIGNDFCIRHHETNKIDVIDNNYYDYFFHRCYALIDLAIKYLR